MIKIFILFSMLFCHVIADYNLQGVLAQMKQKAWWGSEYKYDWIPALIAHSISWSFVIMLPIALYYHLAINWLFVLLFFINTIGHFYIDNEKANKHTIDLVLDQLLHCVQIIATFIVLM